MPNFAVLSALSVASFMVGVFASTGQAQDTFLMQSFPEPGADMKVIGGAPAVPGQWPVTLVFTPDTGGGCTSTIIGEKVLLTAAHCVGNGAKGSVNFGAKVREVQCVHHGQYRGGNCGKVTEPVDTAGCTADIALCFVTDGTFPVDKGQFERIKTAPPPAAKGDRLKLVGYGCTVDGGYMSSVLLTSNPDPTVEHGSTPGASKVDKKKTMLEYIKTASGGAVCKGDSGGAIFSGTGAGRQIAGVASRGNMSTTSYIANLQDPDNHSFVKSETTKRNAPVCGLDAAARNCKP